MDFKTVIGRLITAFDGQGIVYGLIGGYAVGLWGVPRGTVDLDFLVRRNDMDRVHVLMQSLGYELHFTSENVSQYIASSALFGEIDFLHAFREASLGMLARVVEKRVFQDGISIKTLIPEDLIGLKIQALSNNPDREGLDRYDIETLMKLHGKTMDWNLMEGYFHLFELAALFQELKEKYHDAD